MVIGGGYGVGKTIWGLQVSRNMLRSDPKRAAIYVCYEHDRSHLLSRLLCLESAELGNDPDGGLTLRRLGQIAATGDPKEGLVTKLRKMPRYAPVLDEIESYANRLILVKASGVHSSLEQIRDWCYSTAGQDHGSCCWWWTICRSRWIGAAWGPILKIPPT